jgi:hypothetical protein
MQFSFFCSLENRVNDVANLKFYYHNNNFEPVGFADLNLEKISLNRLKWRKSHFLRRLRFCFYIGYRN